MTQSSYLRPNNSDVLLPHVLSKPGSIQPVRQANADSAAGTMFTTINDFGKLGRSILNSTLLSPALTRRWLKPHSDTASKDYSVGAPWEIYRRALNNRTVDLYTRTGDVASWSVSFILVPNYNAGFAVMAVSADPTAWSTTTLEDEAHLVASAAANTIGGVMLPVLESIASSQALAIFAGVYRDDSTNSSMTITVDAALAGMSVTQLIALGGVDLIGGVLNRPTMAYTSVAAWTLQPNNLQTAEQAAFRLLPQAEHLSIVHGAVTEPCITWAVMNQQSWNNRPFDGFVFDMGATGQVLGVTPDMIGRRLAKVA